MEYILTHLLLGHGSLQYSYFSIRGLMRKNPDYWSKNVVYRHNTILNREAPNVVCEYWDEPSSKLIVCYYPITVFPPGEKEGYISVVFSKKPTFQLETTGVRILHLLFPWGILWISKDEKQDVLTAHFSGGELPAVVGGWIVGFGGILSPNSLITPLSIEGWRLLEGYPLWSSTRALLESLKKKAKPKTGGNT